jgi:K+-sensing histidine kinase KdpD
MIESGNATQPTQTQTPGVTILVEDNGPGVAEDDRDQIFRRGFRSDRTASEVEGRGIGLDISRALLARMGGCLGLVCEEHYKAWGLVDYGLGGAAMKIEVTRKLYKLAER